MFTAKVFRLSEIPKQKYPSDATPAQISHHNMDLSYCLETLLASQYHNGTLNMILSVIYDIICLCSLHVEHSEILGELQFSFICFLLGHGILHASVLCITMCTKFISYAVYDAFEHWKELVKLICCAEDALSAHKDLFVAFISK